MRKSCISLFFVIFTLAGIFNAGYCFGQPTGRDYRLSRDAFSDGIRKGVINEFSRAIEYFDLAISLDSTYSEAFLYRGLANYELMRYDKSLKDLTMAYWLDARLEGQIHYYLGHVKAALHDFEGAIDHLTKAIQTDPDYSAYFERGRSFYCILLYDTAIIDFNNSLRLNPNLTEALLYRAKTSFYNNDLNKALQDFVAYCKKTENDSIAHYYIDYIEQLTAREKELAKYPEITDTFDISDTPLDTLAETDTDSLEETTNAFDTEEAERHDLAYDAEPGKETIPDDENSIYIEKTDFKNGDLLDDEEVTEQEFLPNDIGTLDEGFYNVSLERVDPRGMGVQILTLAQHEQLLETVRSYQQQFGYPVYINISGNGGRRLYRIVIGSFISRDEALALRTRLRDHGYSDSFIIRYP